MMIDRGRSNRREERSSPPLLDDERDVDRSKSIATDLCIRNLSDFNQSLQLHGPAASAKFRWDNLLAGPPATPFTLSGHVPPENWRSEMEYYSRNFAPTREEKGLSPLARDTTTSFGRTYENFPRPEPVLRGLGSEGFAFGGSSMGMCSTEPLVGKIYVNECACRREEGFNDHSLNSSLHNASENFGFPGEHTEAITSTDSHFSWWNPNPIPDSSSRFSGKRFPHSDYQASVFANSSPQPHDPQQTFLCGENSGTHRNLGSDGNSCFKEHSSGGGLTTKHAPFGRNCVEEKPPPITTSRVVHIAEEADGFATVDCESVNNRNLLPNPLKMDKQEVLNGESQQVQGNCNSQRESHPYEGKNHLEGYSNEANDHLVVKGPLPKENDSAGMQSRHRIIDLKNIRKSRLSELTEDIDISKSSIQALTKLTEDPDASKSPVQNRDLNFNHAGNSFVGLQKEQTTYWRNVGVEHDCSVSASRHRRNMEMFVPEEYRQRELKSAFTHGMIFHREDPQCTSELHSHQILVQEEELMNQNVYDGKNQRKRVIESGMSREHKHCKVDPNFDASDFFSEIKYQDEEWADENLELLMHSRKIDGNQIQDKWLDEVPNQTLVSSSRQSSPSHRLAAKLNMRMPTSKSVKNRLGIAENGYGLKPLRWTKGHLHNTYLKKNFIDVQETVDAYRLKLPEVKPVHAETRPLEDTPEFIQRVDRMFLKLFKIFNENSAISRKYTAKGSMGPLTCCVCGSQSKEFLDAQSLAMHSFMSPKIGIRAEHLGLHKALCLLMGWKSASASSLKWVRETLPEAEALALKEEIIIWPPVVVIHNSSVSKNNSAERIMVNTEELRTILRAMGFKGVTISRGRPANQSIMIATFDKCLTGLEVAEKLHKHFTDHKRGRAAFQEMISSCSSSSSISSKIVKGEAPQLQMNRAAPILYGYLGTAFDLEKLDFESKKHCRVESRKKLKLGIRKC